MNLETEAILLGRLCASRWDATQDPVPLRKTEFKVFSQFGDDGIIQYIVSRIPEIPNTFVEFGVENYKESNTRFLLEKDNWNGLVMDGSDENVDEIRRWGNFWRFDLMAVSAFITKENINGLIHSNGFAGDLGILSIDIDGNDYWVWEEISCIDPVVVIVEYNSVFGKKRKITIPYDKGFVRADAHYSNLFYGASLASLDHLAEEKGYKFIGSNSAGNNAYFVKAKYHDRFVVVSHTEGYVESKFREARSRTGELLYLSGSERAALIGGLEVMNVETGRLEPF